ncbi:glycosyl transferase family 90-domain-containing protein [Mycena alexandri]|uniref:Glycosyl transferase family 90-domain-containing protein n=1 Tax=Mycena alexandri TaxID=1745969 RepID=A0AAD6S9C2_9AGAR|nr:glycosyl transferase family 90-domain-containing protein [Mycena alexandri]
MASNACLPTTAIPVVQHSSAEPEPDLLAPSLAPTPNATKSPLDPVAIADRSIHDLYARQSQTLEQAIARYALRNNRPPPMQFDKWYNFARDKNCLIDDYDQITRDFAPFYQLAEEDPAHFQKMIDKGRELVYLDIVLLVQFISHAVQWAHILPDSMFLINGRDEPRVVFNIMNPSTLHRCRLPTSSNTEADAVPSIADMAPLWTPSKTLHVSPIFTPFSCVPKSPPVIRSSSSSDFTTDLWPILSMTKISPCFSDILFPGQYYYESSGWSGKFAKPNDVQWDDKKPQLYWRGQSNGGHIIHNNHHKFSRFRLVKIAQNRSDIIDAKMTGFWEWHCTFDCERDPIIEEYKIGSEGSPREEVYNYKYLLDVDGNTFSGRYLGLLRSGSLVFKATAFDEYFNDWLRPYEHYIPVKIDMSDLVEKVEWAIAHNAEARQIQETGMQFAQRVLTDSQNDCYFSRVLLEWARLQSYAKQSTVPFDE